MPLSMNMRLEVPYRDLFGEWIRSAREKKGWSHKRLSEEAGMSRSAISDLERLGKRPGPETMKRLARALDLNLRDVQARAGVLTPQIRDALKGSPALWTLVSTIIDQRLTEEKIQEITEVLTEAEGV